MHALTSSIRRFLSDEGGPTSAEYAVMLAMIIAVLITAIQAVGGPTFSLFSGSANKLP